MKALCKFEGDLSMKLAGLPPKAELAVLMYATTKAKVLESKMKMNRPWTDRTGYAKAMLSATVSRKLFGVRITLAHGAPYGVWLELAHEKRYAIVGPTVNTEGPVVFSDLSGLLSKMK